MTDRERIRYHLLVVDDEAMSVALLERTFAGASRIRVTTTTSPVEALAVARREAVDVVIADQRMPEMYGVDFLIELRKLRPEAIPIVLTAYPELSLVIRALNEARIFQFLTKPCDPTTVQDAVDRALEMLELRRVNLELTARLAHQNGELERTIERLEAAQTELVRSEKMAAIGRLCAGLAHELASPATILQYEQQSVAGTLEGLLRLGGAVEHAVTREGLDVGADTRRAYQELVGEGAVGAVRERTLRAIALCGRAIGSIRTLVQCLRNYSHPGDRRPAPWNVNEGIEIALHMLRHRFKGHVAVLAECGQLPDVVCFGQEIGQVLLNLLSNAADALEGQADAEIHVRTERVEDFIRIDVVDNGSGMDEETRGRLFQPFFTTKPVGKGTGLGLSISRQIIENHGGRIEVESHLGKGTRFSVFLPITPPASCTLGHLYGQEEHEVVLHPET